jgi:hypothetical protein
LLYGEGKIVFFSFLLFIPPQGSVGRYPLGVDVVKSVDEELSFSLKMDLLVRRIMGMS